MPIDIITKAEQYRDAAAAMGYAEDMLIAMRALGEQVDPDQEWNCGKERAQRIARMTPRGARRIVARWQ